MTNLPPEIQADIEAVNRIPIVSSLLDVVCRTTGMRFAAIARVTDKQWVACSVKDEISFGLKPGGELKLETTICNEIRQTNKAVAINEVSKDAAYCKHPTPAMYGFESYISIPIYLRNGDFFGTLCAIDPSPAEVNNPKVIGMFELFADLISFHLASVEQLKQTEAMLKKEQETGKLREEFIAILGHDLRNPVSAIRTGSEALLQAPMEDGALKVVKAIRNSSYRITELIDNMLDFARGRLGDGISINIQDYVDIEQLIKNITAEIQSIWPKSIIETHLELDEPIRCDRRRIAQLLSNLLNNAVTHGSPDQPVRIEAKSDRSVFSLSVINHGERIPIHTMNRLFHPFARGSARSTRDGLGLGLYICSEIARAHGGKINTTSTANETRFIFEMPLQ